ncbi:hypothetical protein ACFXTI_013057 [Malus domestica]
MVVIGPSSFNAFHRGGIQSFVTHAPASPYNGEVQMNDVPKIIPTIVLDKRGLKGQRFLAWYRHIENVSKVKDILYVLKQSPPHVPPTKLASKEECQNYVRHYEDD